MIPAVQPCAPHRRGRLLVHAILAAILIGSTASAQTYKAPKTSFGHPDLQGDWNNLSFTRLQRPPAFKSLVVTEADAAPWLAEQRNLLVGIKPPRRPGDPPEAPGNDVGDVESEQYELDDVGLARIDGQLRSSWIVDPADGRLPYNAVGRSAAEAARRTEETDFRGPEVRMPNERCLTGIGGSAGPPMLNTAQNSHYKIVQTPTEIAILVEMIHDVRIIRLNARHPQTPTHPWLGDSIGWWEGDTLVVETVDQHAISSPRVVRGGLMQITPAGTVTERFTRISHDQIRYEFTVDDPAVYDRRWRAELVLNATTRPMYEYACHEGNYSLANILAGAREQEREAGK